MVPKFQGSRVGTGLKKVPGSRVRFLAEFASSCRQQLPIPPLSALLSPAIVLLPMGVMPGWKDFRDIVAWQRARELKLRVDQLLQRPDVKTKFKYCDQLSDAARSAPRNIAEGFGRFGNKDFARFARIAKGSELEVLNHLIDAQDQGLITKRSEEHTSELQSQSNLVCRLLLE